MSAFPVQSHGVPTRWYQAEKMCVCVLMAGSGVWGMPRQKRGRGDWGGVEGHRGTRCYCAPSRWHSHCQWAALIRELAIWILPQITLKFQAQEYIKLNEYWIQGPQTGLMGGEKKEKPCATQLFCGQTWSIHPLYARLLFPSSLMGLWFWWGAEQEGTTDIQQKVHLTRRGCSLERTGENLHGW